MSVRADAAAVRPHALNSVPVACGVIALLLRIVVVGAPGATATFVAILVALATISVAVPVPTDVSTPLRPVAALIIGIAAVIGASALFGAGVPLPHGGSAVALGVGAAIAEELFFRRLVYGVLVPWHPVVAIAGSAVLFALVHVPLYGAAVFWVDLGAGLLFSWQRWASGGWRAPAATHVVANVLAVLR